MIKEWAMINEGADVRTILARIRQLQSENAAKKSNYDYDTQFIIGIKTELAAKDATIAYLTGRIDAYEIQQSALQSENAAKDAEVIRLRRLVQELEVDYADMRIEKEKGDARIRELKRLECHIQQGRRAIEERSNNAIERRDATIDALTPDAERWRVVEPKLYMKFLLGDHATPNDFADALRAQKKEQS